ncbi:MAG: transcription-repair coupling factor [Verrucomicrobiales bacterium]|nr:transcription-repair coupling factor [Verrucomicrobiales bacterium]
MNTTSLVERVAATLQGASFPLGLDPVSPPAWSLVAAAAVRLKPSPDSRLWFLCPDIKSQERIHLELNTWGAEATFFPELDLTGFIDAIPDPESTAERLAVLHDLAKPQNHSHLVLLGSSLDEDVQTPATLSDREQTLSTGTTLDLDAFTSLLAKAGYERIPQVAERGQFALRGGILDIFSWHASDPVRIELFDDELESIRTFDVHAQTSIAKTQTATILLDRPSTSRNHARNFCKLSDYIAPQDIIVSFGGIDTPVAPHLTVDESELATASPLTCLENPITGFGAGDFILQHAKRKAFHTQLAEWLGDGWEIAMFFNNEGEIERFRELVTEADPTERHIYDTVAFLTGAVARGYTSPEAKLAILTDAEIFGRYQHQRARRMFSREKGQNAVRQATSRLADFNEGDVVVHLDYGLARYRGLIRQSKDDSTSGEDSLTLEFAEGSKLYVPVDQAHLVSRYVGSGGKTPPLSKLGDARWGKARASAERSILDYAASLLSVQAERQVQTGFAHPADSKWQYEFEQSFVFKETPDQLRAIEDSKRDMETARPMDRLICGDVGFGKTEVAIRTAFKAVMGGKQVAILVPTTVLAQQHYENFRQRMSGYPITVGLLSRFRSASQQRLTLSGLLDGSVDIVIGTHRLISKDIIFKDLGLVVIDEEQRFGVKHKERFKELFRRIDVLTLSATPIPRTLYLSLMGARDMSTIETPPPNRVPVDTSIVPYDDRIIRDAVNRELKRGGQVFFLHNRVKTIGAIAKKIADLCPDARVDIGHGQMETGELEDVMHRFVDAGSNVLVCTTIIESGVDIPNANTIIIDRADRFGLADLYQLRGRVGRAGSKAYAILLLPRDMVAAGDARKRITAIKQFSALGSGFRIAMRDLEIRGAGNLLGTKQSGHIAAVGFDLYCRLLKQSVAKLQGKPVPGRIDSALHTDFLITSESSYPRHADDPEKLAAFIPSTYISDPELRVSAYREIAELATTKQINVLLKSWRDRFGPLPPPADNLLRSTELRIAAQHAGIATVEILNSKLMLTRNSDYILLGNKFPRLRSPDPASRLREAVDMVKKI